MKTFISAEHSLDQLSKTKWCLIPIWGICFPFDISVPATFSLCGVRRRHLSKSGKVAQIFWVQPPSVMPNETPSFYAMGPILKKKVWRIYEKECWIFELGFDSYHSCICLAQVHRTGSQSCWSWRCYTGSICSRKVSHFQFNQHIPWI